MTPWTAEEVLRTLIGSADEGAFFERHWERAALHVPGDPVRFAELYDSATFFGGHGLSELDAATQDARGQHTQFEILPAQMRSLYDAGMTLCADISSDSRVAPLLAGLKGALALTGPPAFAKVYASPDGAGFGLHADAHHVFVLQLEGEKHWRYSPTPALTAPLAGMKVGPGGDVVHAFPMDAVPVMGDDGSPLEAPETLEEVVLTPGDSMYLPPGTWHAARAMGASFAVSVSPPRSPACDVLTRILRDALRSDPAWRSDVAIAPADPSAGVARVRERLAQLTRALATADPTELTRLWCIAAVHERPDATPCANGHAPERDDRLERVDPSPLLYCVASREEPPGEIVCFYAAGEELTFPAEALPFVAGLARHRVFRAGDVLSWDPKLDWESAKSVLTQLLDASVLRIRH